MSHASWIAHIYWSSRIRSFSSSHLIISTIRYPSPIQQIIKTIIIDSLKNSFCGFLLYFLIWNADLKLFFLENQREGEEYASVAHFKSIHYLLVCFDYFFFSFSIEFQF